MADFNKVYVHLDIDGNEIRNFSIEKLEDDPTGSELYEGRIWFNTTDKRLRSFDGTVIQNYATLADLTSIGRFQGLHDASGGLLPTSTIDGSSIVSGDFWRVSTGGTIVGIGGDDVLEIGDLIFANTANASLAVDFQGIQANLNLPGQLGVVEEITLATLTANTPTAIPTNFTEIYNVDVYNSLNQKIWVSLEGTPTATVVESNRTLTGVKFRVSGRV